MKRTEAVWISKEAHTRGIRRVENATLDTDGNAWIFGAGTPSRDEFVRAVDVHKTRESAVARAVRLRDAEIANLERRLAVLRLYNPETEEENADEKTP